MRALALVFAASWACVHASRVVNLYESLRRMSPYPAEHPYARTSFAPAQVLSATDILEQPSTAMGEALRRYCRSVVPRRATKADGTPRPVSVLEFVANGRSYAPAANKGMRVTRIHLTEASCNAFLADNRVGRPGDDWEEDIVQDVTGSAVLLPFVDSSFDCVLLPFVAPLLTLPFEVLAETNRVLVQDGIVLSAIGGPSPGAHAVSMWAGMPPETMLYVLGSYFHYTHAATDGWYVDGMEVHELPSRPSSDSELAVYTMLTRRLGGSALMWRRLEKDRAHRRVEEDHERVERAPLFANTGGLSEQWEGPAGLDAAGVLLRAAEMQVVESGEPTEEPYSPSASAVPVRAAMASASATSSSARSKILSVVEQGVRRACQKADNRELTEAERHVLENLKCEMDGI